MKQEGDGKTWGHSRGIPDLEMTDVTDWLRVKGVLVREEFRMSPGFLPQTTGEMMVTFSVKE